MKKEEKNTEIKKESKKGKERVRESESDDRKEKLTELLSLFY